MNPVRIFHNLRMFDSPSEAAEYLAETMPLRARGYIGPDGTVRLMVELRPVEADLSASVQRGSR